MAIKVKCVPPKPLRQSFPRGSAQEFGAAKRTPLSCTRCAECRVRVTAWLAFRDYKAISRGHLSLHVESPSRKRIMCNQKPLRHMRRDDLFHELYTGTQSGQAILEILRGTERFTHLLQRFRRSVTSIAAAVIQRMFNAHQPAQRERSRCQHSPKKKARQLERHRPHVFIMKRQRGTLSPTSPRPGQNVVYFFDDPIQPWNK